MSLEDPYLIVQNEVFDALHKVRNNFTRWTEVDPNEMTREDYSAFISELKNGLKSLQWDLDELEESLENSERSNALDPSELQKRKSFINQTREEVQTMNEQIKGNNKFKKADYTINFGSSQQPQTGTKYFRLINEPDASNSLTNKNFDDDEHKSPYSHNHSVTLDEVSQNVNVVNPQHNKLSNIKQLWSSVPERPKLIFGVSGSLILIIIMIFFFF